MRSKPWKLFLLVLLLSSGVSFFLWKKSNVFNDELPIESQSIEYNLEEAISKLSVTRGDILEVATLESLETLTRKDTKFLFKRFDLGSTTSEIKVKATYRYHIRLSDPWTSQILGKDFLITAPEIRPSLPPAIHSDSIQKRVESGWLRFNEKESLDALEKSLTDNLASLAMSSSKVLLVQEGARKAVEDFIKAFIFSQKDWKELANYSLKIQFSNEHGHGHGHDDALPQE